MRERIEAVIALSLMPILMQATFATDQPEFGKIPLAKDMTIRIRCQMGGTGEPAILPRGGYCLYEWIITRTDEQGAPWTCSAAVPYDKSVFEVVAQHETELPIGEPLVSTLTAHRRGAEVAFSHHLQGRLEETISLQSNGERAEPPRLRVRNADGSYDKTFPFAYG